MQAEALQTGSLCHEIATPNRPTDRLSADTTVATDMSFDWSPPPSQETSRNATSLFVAELPNLSNDQLIHRVAKLNRTHRLVNVVLLVYLSELDCRRLYREHACSSMFEYLVLRLGQTEDVAYRWLWGARLLRAYPLVHELLTDGKLHLSALMVLKPYLTPENCQDLLMAAAGKSKREIEKLVAATFPKPDAPSRLRRLPETARGTRGNTGESPTTEVTASPGAPSLTMPPSVSATPSVPATPFNCTPSPRIDTQLAERAIPSVPATPFDCAPSTGTDTQLSVHAAPSVPATPFNRAPSTGIDTQPSAHTQPSPLPSPPSRATKMQALSEHSYRLVFTVSERLKAKLDRAGELVSHSIAPRDFPTLLERALDVLIEREERRRYGARRPNSDFATAANNAVAVPSANDEASGNSTTIRQNDERACASAASNEEAETTDLLEQQKLTRDEPTVPGMQNTVASLSPDTQSTVSVAHTKTAVSVANTKTAVSVANTKPAVSVANTKPAVSVAHTKSAVSVAHTKTTLDVDSPRRNAGSRYLPAEVRRQVRERDADQCSYVDREGRRCQCRHRLEFDHFVPHALGGSPTVDNIRLVCRAHNALAAERVFGRERITSAITAARQQHHRPGTTPAHCRTEKRDAK